MPIDIERTHPLYDKHHSEWKFFLESAMGGKDYVSNVDNLFSHRLKSMGEDHQKRQERTTYLNFCNLVCRSYADCIFKETIRRPEDKLLSNFYSNVDGRGTKIDQFMMTASFLSSVFGHVHVLVDTPSANPEAIPMHQFKSRQGAPYAVIVTPLQLRDWSVDAFGNFNWVLIHHAGYDDSTPYVERERSDRYLLITRDYWERYDGDGKLLDGNENPLGEVYMTTLFEKNMDRDGIGESLITDISRINRAIYNYCSNIDEMIARQTFSQLVMPEDPHAELGERGEGDDPLMKLGTSSIFTFPANSGQPPRFISPNTDCIDVVWKIITKLIGLIYEQAGLTTIGTQSKFKSQTSGIAQAYRYTRLNVAMAKKATALQKAEREIVRLVGKWYGKQQDNIVEYPREFDVYSTYENMVTTFNIVAQNISATLNIELLKTLAKKSLSSLSDDQMAQIYKEITINQGRIRSPLKE